MTPKLHVKHDEVDAALNRLGLTRNPLFEAIIAGLLARDACTAGVFRPGGDRYCEAAARLDDGAEISFV
jgi:hypothetical protein